jgi:hypothetical protein
LSREPSLYGGDPAVNNEPDRNSAQAHPNEFRKGNRRIRNLGTKPDTKEVGENEHQHDADDRGNADEN